MKFLILALVTVLATSCDLFKKSEPTNTDAAQVTIESPPVALTKNEFCKDGMASPEALGVWKMANGTELYVCSLNTSYTKNENEMSGWINIYEKAKDGEFIKYIHDVAGEKPNGYFTYNVKKTSDTTVVVSREIVPSNQAAADDENFIVTEAILDCSKGPCKLGKEKCVGTLKHEVDEAAIKKVEGVIVGKVKSDEGEYYDITLAKLVKSALAGDKKALKYVKDTPYSTLKTDGAATEELVEGKYLIEKLIELKCLKHKK